MLYSALMSVATTRKLGLLEADVFQSHKYLVQRSDESDERWTPLLNAPPFRRIRPFRPFAQLQRNGLLGSCPSAQSSLGLNMPHSHHLGVSIRDLESRQYAGSEAHHIFPLKFDLVHLKNQSQDACSVLEHGHKRASGRDGHGDGASDFQITKFQNWQMALLLRVLVLFPLSNSESRQRRGPEDHERHQPSGSTTMRSSKYKTDPRVEDEPGDFRKGVKDQQTLQFGKFKFQKRHVGYLLELVLKEKSQGGGRPFRDVATAENISPRSSAGQVRTINITWVQLGLLVSCRVALLGLVVASEILLRACRPLVVLLVTREDGGGGHLNGFTRHRIAT
ncbi:hypothetical protein C8J56DRAFT_1031904 [Mycena floridula]|nr:hypothetical protein C8J56DRAFT_1031904 [Mycena floridula]